MHFIMKKRINKKTILILSILLVFIIMGAASAANDDNTTLSDDSGSEDVMTQDSVEKADTVSTDADESTNVLVDDNSTGSFSELKQYINDTKGYNKIVTLEKNYTFDDKDMEVGAIYLGSYVAIDGCNHTIDAKNNTIFNIIGKHVLLKNIIFKNAHYSIEISGNDIDIINCTFDNCSSLKSDKNVIGLSFEDCTFKNGGNLQIYSEYTIIKNCTFRDNIGSNGGAIFINANHLLIDNCEFINNTAKKGGAIYFSYTNGNETLTIKKSKFIKNGANIGGAIYNNYRSLNINNDVYKNQYVDFNSTVNIIESIFDSNIAVNSPNIFGHFTIHNCECDDGLYYDSIDEKFDGKTNGTIILEEDYTLTEGPITIELINSIFTIDGNGHTITGEKGVFNFNSRNSTVFIKNIKFNNSNYTPVCFNSIYTPFTDPNLPTIFFIDNCSFNNNQGSKGGAVYYSSGYLTMNITNCSFYNNSAEYGGAIFGNYLNTFNVINSTFEKNTAKHGGAIYTDMTNRYKYFNTQDIINSTFTNNTAVSYGSICAPAWRLINNSFINNYAEFKSIGLFQSEIDNFYHDNLESDLSKLLDTDSNVITLNGGI